MKCDGQRRKLWLTAAAFWLLRAPRRDLLVRARCRRVLLVRATLRRVLLDRAASMLGPFG